MNKIPFRQIHLDFHTSPYIENIAENFNKDEFISTLKSAHVNSINLFAKCHHGMYYYPTKIGTMHPNLKFDLFGEQVKACKEAGIRAVAYTCVAWNEDWADRHPEWQTIDFTGILGGKKPFECGYYSWRNLCINNPEYKTVLKEELKEIFDNYHPDGYWIDIVLGKNCVCPYCREDMENNGLNPEDYQDVQKYNKISETKFCKEFYTYLKELDAELEIYFNSLPYELDNAEELSCSSVAKRTAFDFIDIESLPSEMWGYTHFPIAANYINKYEKDICMMNGKFHTSWGDFGSIRNKKALEYECFRALAYGARICVGDQLHPSGKLEKAVYQRIGEIYEKVEKIENYVDQARKVRDVCVLIPTKPGEVDPMKGGIIEEGVYRVLSELHIPFDFVNNRDSFNGYQLLILPDEIDVNEDLAKKIDEFVYQGGKILVTGKSAVKDNHFQIQSICAEYIKPSQWDVRYVRLNRDEFRNIPEMDHILYCAGECVKAKKDTEVLAELVDPYFVRNYKHFCSHRQTPPRLNTTGESFVIRNKNCIYIAAPLFKAYANYGYKVYKDILENCLKMLYVKPCLITDLPSLTDVTLWEKEEGLFLHMLNFVVEKKARLLNTIEEEYVVTDRMIKIRCDFLPRNVVKLPERIPVVYEVRKGYVFIRIEKEQGYSLFWIQK